MTLRNVDKDRAGFQRLAIKPGKEYAIGDIVRIVERPRVKSGLLKLLSFYPDETLGAIFTEFGVSLDHPQESDKHRQMQAMDQENKNLWSALSELNDLLGSDYKLKDLQL